MCRCGCIHLIVKLSLSLSTSQAILYSSFNLKHINAIVSSSPKVAHWTSSTDLMWTGSEGERNKTKI